MCGIFLLRAPRKCWIAEREFECRFFHVRHRVFTPADVLRFCSHTLGDWLVGKILLWIFLLMATRKYWIAERECERRFFHVRNRVVTSSEVLSFATTFLWSSLFWVFVRDMYFYNNPEVLNSLMRIRVCHLFSVWGVALSPFKTLKFSTNIFGGNLPDLFFCVGCFFQWYELWVIISLL